MGWKDHVWKGQGWKGIKEGIGKIEAKHFVTGQFWKDDAHMKFLAGKKGKLYDY